MALIHQHTRVQHRSLLISGQVPTIPTVSDETQVGWLPTDMYLEEIVINTVDNKAWTRTDNGIFEISLGALNYEFAQNVPSAFWVVAHPLNRKPSVTIIDSGGNTVIGDYTYIDNSTIHIQFAASFSGIALLN